jgi:hypothetical protein
MSKIETLKGIFRVFVQMTREEFYYMDKKLIKIAGGVISFLIAGAIWFFFFRHVNPFF